VTFFHVIVDALGLLPETLDGLLTRQTVHDESVDLDIVHCSRCAHNVLRASFL
jgi:hypothetical protein